jgi:phage baseplate assembly protein W
MKVQGLSPQLPLTLDNEDGYALIKTHKKMIHQNLKMLLLTVPGERIMNPEFGVGLKQFLFEPNTTLTQGEIEAKINEQLDLYMPYVQVVRLSFDTIETNPELNDNYIHIRLEYYVDALEELGVVDLDFDFSKQLFI